VNLLKKIKNVIFLVLILLLINVIFIEKKFFIGNNGLNKTIFVEFSPKYMTANNQDETEYIKLYKNNNEFNEKFNVLNMFPGDAETKYYCVNVSYKNDITLKYSASIDSKYKLGDVLKFKVKLIGNDELLYDGLIKDMPEYIDYNTSSDEEVSEDFCYEITTYLDTSVGNEYQENEAVVNFRWIVDGNDLENESNPVTVDNIVFWIGLAFVSGILLFISLIFKVKGRD